MNTANPKPIFLYLKACPLSARQLKKIAEAGYVAVPVESLDSVRVVEPMLLFPSDPISKSAFQAISACSSDYPSSLFGRRVAKALGGQ